MNIEDRQEYNDRSERTYYLNMLGGGTNRTYTFHPDSYTGRGWVKLRLIRIEDDPQIITENGAIPTPVYYDPEIHTPGSRHYCARLWIARWSKSYDTIILHGAFGNPGSQIPLDWY